MTLDEARKNIGRRVVYTATRTEPERGTIVNVSSRYVFVQYEHHRGTQATPAERLTLD